MGMHGSMAGVVDFDAQPMLVFWESTRACLLSCRHCRAEAIETPLPNELSTEEGRRFIEGLAAFGQPPPVLIVTGGGAVMRPDLTRLIDHARRVGVPVGLSPSVTPRLTPEVARELTTFGIKAASISLDGAFPETHERIRGVPGHFDRTLAMLRRFVELGYTLQVNTTVMRDNVHELPDIVRILKEIGVRIWEVFFLIHVGRGTEMREPSPVEYEDVMHFLFEVSCHGIQIRTVEGPFFRRVVAWRLADGPRRDVKRFYHLTSLYEELADSLAEKIPGPLAAPLSQTAGTRDGKGIIFVGAEGEIYPAGFLPIPLGNVRQDDLVKVYRDHPLLKEIRAARFTGRCGRCEFADPCGGSRARAWASSGDALAEDPACAYVPPIPGERPRAQRQLF